MESAQKIGDINMICSRHKWLYNVQIIETLKGNRGCYNCSYVRFRMKAD
jgi:hypothetical protein